MILASLVYIATDMDGARFDMDSSKYLIMSKYKYL